MTRNWTIMAGLMALAACGEIGVADGLKPAMPVSSQGTSRPLPILNAGASETPSGDCTGKRIGEPLILTLDKKSIKQLGGMGQQINRHVSRGRLALPNPPVLYGDILYPTNLDIQANSNKTLMGKSDYVEVQIRLEAVNLKKRDLIFLRTSAGIVPADGNDPAAAVTVRKGDEKYFCFLGPIERNGDIETVRLGSKLVPYAQSSINIGVQVANLEDNRFSTPIYIDPNVRNEG